MQCLVLGGAGFIGSHVVDALLEHGHDVRIFDRQNISTRNIVQALPRVKLVGGDFLNEDDLRSAIEGIDTVVHLVGTTLPKSSNDNVVYDIETNVIGTVTLLDLAKQAGVRKIVFASSGGTVYGLPQALPIPETHPTEPICSYGITKLIIEKYLHLYYYLYGLEYTVLRIANPYGERQNPASGQGAVTTFLWKTLRSETISIWGDGTVARDYLYIGDLVSVFMTAIEGKTPSRLYNIGSGVPHTLIELLEIVEAITGQTPVVQYTSSRKLDVPVNFLDIARARKELLWKPQVSMEEGMARTWAWLQHHDADRE